jgi:hypothetical protein
MLATTPKGQYIPVRTRGGSSHFADRDLAEDGAFRPGEVLKSGRDLMCRSNP